MNSNFIVLKKPLICSLFLCSLSVYGNDLKTQLENDLPTLMEKVIDWRHDIHQHPELGNREFNTAKKIAGHLLEAAETDIKFQNGRFLIDGTDQSVSIEDVAKTAYSPLTLPLEIEPTLVASAAFAASDALVALVAAFLYKAF